MKRILFQKSFGCIILCCLVATAGMSCVKLPRRAALTREQIARPTPPSSEAASQISINRSSRKELERLPGIGPALAARIVEHRERYGPFRRTEHLLIVRGISERRFRQIRPFINAE